MYIFLLLINEEFVIRVISYFGGSCFATPPVKGLLQSWLFGRDFGGLSRKAEFATRIKNTSALPKDFMHSVLGRI
jgi:hypothetical protein